MWRRVWSFVLFLRDSLGYFTGLLRKISSAFWFNLFRVCVKFMGFVEARAVVEEIMCSDYGRRCLFYAGYDYFREVLVGKGARVVYVEESNGEDDYPSEFCVLLFRDRRVELFWKFKVVELTEVSWIKVSR